ncbi:hypothetical protein KOEU_25740 [Komagataeibacter europaeus]|uniref:Uncharacterized protein n=1 Tax=Komagataeibacter europaeus TaxID=33995 RepID=A0A0M0EF14_KOMEU|nr:hypothetical protein KOEU_25740 [Komagataeibacter europaeus]
MPEAMPCNVIGTGKMKPFVKFSSYGRHLRQRPGINARSAWRQFEFFAKIFQQMYCYSTDNQDSLLAPIQHSYPAIKKYFRTQFR